MFFGDWEVKIEKRYNEMTNYVYLVQKGVDGKQLLTKEGVIVKVKPGNAPTVPLHFAEFDDAQLQAFANALADFGVKNNNDSKTEGLLVATERHLEDMRRLVFDSKE